MRLGVAVMRKLDGSVALLLGVGVEGAAGPGTGPNVSRRGFPHGRFLCPMLFL
jgi:hypothetical protein